MHNFPKSKLNDADRRKRRLAWRNEFNLYKTVCAQTAKPVISMYKPSSPFPIYSAEAWFGDAWDALDYGQDFDFNRPFFEQFLELQNKVPRLSNITVNSENSDFCNIVGDCRNCYFLFGSVNCEDCMYGSPYSSKNCIDTLGIKDCSYCYECVDCTGLYECFYCQNCNNSSNLEYCFDVSGSKNCFLSVGLRKAEFCILNKKYSKAEYIAKVAELKKKSPEELLVILNEFKPTVPVKNLEGLQNENVLGDHVNNSKNCSNVFNVNDSQNIYNSTQILSCNDCSQADFGEYSSFVYESSGFYKCHNVAFTHWCWEISDCLYSSVCYGATKDCFGCIGLNKKQYCILNKQYTKEEYEELLPKIIEHMKRTGEWGEFFPVENSPFDYSDSLAELYFPSTQANLQKKDFIITTQEKMFYQKFALPEPLLDPVMRHKKRIYMRNSHVFHQRNCAKCAKMVYSTYSPAQPQIIYCEDCYLQNL